jgi:iron complex transport system substrate-binding protein
VVNFEQIAAWNPDQIFVVSYQTNSAQIVENLKADPQWQALQTVQSDAIYGFPADLFSWDQPDPRWILGVTWLAGKIQPDLFPALDVQQEAVEFFNQMYGMDEAAIESSLLPHLKGTIK